MDPDTQEIKALLQKNLEFSQETNHMVHAMRRNARFANLVRVVYWLAIIGVIGASYYFYVAPYITKIESALQQTQMSTSQAQSTIQNFGQSLQKLLSVPQAPTTSGR